MTSKHKGICPFCKNEVVPRVTQENHVRRDKCKCPECKEDIYVCRAPGCENYAKGGHLYDDELCPSCTSSVGNGASSLGMLALGAAITAFVSKKME
ncbi:hypothetical protein PEC106664_44480 [Pectobacterium carotovorum subsp. carotovorum]|nr:hypothetical protein PEC106664_44480 [Pectobacterium carotovorum subsp. carotovorum]